MGGVRLWKVCAYGRCPLADIDRICLQAIQGVHFARKGSFPVIIMRMGGGGVEGDLKVD